MSAEGPRNFKGIGTSPGYAVGRVYLIAHEEQVIPRRTIGDHEIDDEIDRFDHAVDRSRRQLDELLKRMRAASEEGILIIEAHRMMLQDVMLVGRVHRFIEDDKLNAEAALDRTLRVLAEAFANLQESYFKERGSELRFVGQRVMRNLLGTYRPRSGTIPSGAIVVAHELSPPEALELTARRIAGFVMEVGGRTSHTAIMARAMEIPAVLGAHGIATAVANGQQIVLDGTSGSVVVDPDKETIAVFRERRRLHRARAAKLLANRSEDSITTDGVRIRLQGNIEYAEELESLHRYGGEGIGLYRTEYFFMRGNHLPDEQAQFEAYRRSAEEVAPNHVTFRMLDVGGDKIPTGFPMTPNCDNPALGLRGIRLALRERAVMITQLRALLRASAFGDIRLLIPFVTSVTDVREVKQIIAELTTVLRSDGHVVADNIPLGCMIEVPSAALIADLLAPEVEFFSIGTNDLCQYTLAIDRGAEEVADLYNPLHPAVLRLIERTARAGRAFKIEVALCGEMAGEPLNIPVLIGCGLTSLSMNPISIPAVKEVIRNSSSFDCRALLQEIMTYPTVELVEERVREFHRTELAGLLTEDE